MAGNTLKPAPNPPPLAVDRRVFFINQLDFDLDADLLGPASRQLVAVSLIGRSAADSSARARLHVDDTLQVREVNAEKWNCVWLGVK